MQHPDLIHENIEYKSFFPEKFNHEWIISIPINGKGINYLFTILFWCFSDNKYPSIDI